jgi:hypothetical protein
MSSRIGLVGLALASAVVGGIASSYAAIAVAQTQPAASPAPPPRATRFEHWCSTMDGMGLKVAGERGWEMVAAYTSLSGASVVLKGTTGAFAQVATTLPVTPTTYCFKRAVP